MRHHVPATAAGRRAETSERPRHERSRGQSLVEFALILPVMLVLFASALDLGRLFYAQITIRNAAREGAFQAAQTPTSYRDGQPCDPVTNRVVCRVVLESKDSFVTVAPADVEVACTPDCDRELGHVVSVTVTGHFHLITPVLAFAIPDQDVTLTATAVGHVEVLPPAPEPTDEGDPEPPPPPCRYPPDIIGMKPTDAAVALGVEGFVAESYGDLTTGPKNEVRAQNPDATQCVDPGSVVTFHYRPL